MLAVWSRDGAVKIRHDCVHGVLRAGTMAGRPWRNCCPCCDANRSVGPGARRSDDLTNETCVAIQLFGADGCPRSQRGRVWKKSMSLEEDRGYAGSSRAIDDAGVGPVACAGEDTAG
jgi:hypothetical protein